MSRNMCCVPGCQIVKDDGIPLHRFPDPKSNHERYMAWVSTIGDLLLKEKKHVYNNLRVCRKHFKAVYLYPNHQLCKLAIPELQLSDAEPRDQPLVQEGVTQCEKRVDTEQRNQSLVRERITQRENWPDAEQRGRRLIREGETQQKRPAKPLHATESAGPANRPQNSDSAHDRLQPKQDREKRFKTSYARAMPATNTLPGTCKPQPGPSGTGPVKRDRPDDTASPSTLQGDAKRMRVHSAQGEQRSYARATKDIPSRLAVAICFPPSSRDLTKEEAEDIKTELERLIMETDPTTPLPAFRGYPRLAEGTVKMWCEDDNALTWLTQNVPNIKLADTDLTLTVLRRSDVPTRVRASLFVPRYKGAIDQLLSILIRQNTWYEIARWSLYRATAVGGDNYGTYLTLGVPPEEVERVLARERRISYLLGSIYVCFWPTTLPSDTKTDSTDAMTALTLTDNTDITQFEVMARATIDYDLDTILASSPGWNEQLLASSPGDQQDDQHRVEVVENLYDGSISN